MIKDIIPKFFVTCEVESDGGLESLLSIIKHYKGNSKTLNLKHLINELYENKNSFECLSIAAYSHGLIAVICHDIDSKTVIEYNQPIIINIAKSDSSNHFIACFGLNDKNELKICDYKNGAYSIPPSHLSKIMNKGTCLAFANA